MADNYTDITKTGPLNYRQLQKQNATDYAETELSTLADARKHFDVWGDDILAASRAGTARLDDYKVQSPLYHQSQGTDYYGNSVWDDDIVVGQHQFENELNDRRAENQWTIAKWGSALGNATGLAATTFLDGTVGLLTGAVEGVGTLVDPDERKKGAGTTLNNAFSKLWDNELSNGLQDLNEYFQNDLMPYYKTEKAQNTPWY